MRGSVRSLEGKVADREDPSERSRSSQKTMQQRPKVLAARLAAKADVDISSFMEKAADKVQIRENSTAYERRTKPPTASSKRRSTQ